MPPNISEEQLKALLKHVVQEETKKNSDIDEVVVFAHGSEADVGGILLYTLGRLEWCPNGVWGNVTSDIAAKNDRTSYQYVFHIRDEVKNLPPANAFKNKEMAIALMKKLIPDKIQGEGFGSGTYIYVIRNAEEGDDNKVALHTPQESADNTK